jgi:hypothetical protein
MMAIRLKRRGEHSPHDSVSVSFRSSRRVAGAVDLVGEGEDSGVDALGELAVDGVGGVRSQLDDATGEQTAGTQGGLARIVNDAAPGDQGEHRHVDSGTWSSVGYVGGGRKAVKSRIPADIRLATGSSSEASAPPEIQLSSLRRSDSGKNGTTEPGVREIWNGIRR